jgi:hypothetical protein
MLSLYFPVALISITFLEIDAKRAFVRNHSLLKATHKFSRAFIILGEILQYLNLG